MRSIGIAAMAALLLLGCIPVPVPAPSDEAAGEMEFVLEEWQGDAVLPYQLITKDDFQSATSNSLWGNIAHGAEICTHILPVDDYDVSGAFRAVMRPDCSFWNKVIGPLGRASRVALAAAGVLTIGGGKQPDWYILQHEQIHFAINELAARKLTARLAPTPPARRLDSTTQRVYELTLQQAHARHVKFDQETSGRFDEFLIEKWTRLLERELEAYCDDGQECGVRNYGR